MEKLVRNSSNRRKLDFTRGSDIALIIITVFTTICWPALPAAMESNGVGIHGQPEPTVQVAERRTPILGCLAESLSRACGALTRYESPLAFGPARIAKQGAASPTTPHITLNPPCREVLVIPYRPPSNRVLEEISATDEEKTAADHEVQDNEQVFTTLSLQENFRVYLVRRGDSLWEIAKRFDMNHEILASINGLNSSAFLQVGRPLKIKVFSSRELRLNLASRSIENHPSLIEEIRLIDGRPVPRWLVTDYVVDIIDKRLAGDGVTDQGNGRRRQTIAIDFQLVKNLLEGRARQYQSMVLAHAAKYDLDPALIMAMIHTESAFDPKARSRSSAYGLMQLVPHTAGAEAYHRIYGQRRTLTPQYLYDPNNNIELGAAYLHILKRGYLGSVSDPLSRTYLAVAAYHAGPSIVGRVFLPNASIKQAAPIINRLKPADVYKRLVEALPAIESRSYVRKVMIRFKKYRGWYAKGSGTRT